MEIWLLVSALLPTRPVTRGMERSSLIPTLSELLSSLSAVNFNPAQKKSVGPLAFLEPNLSLWPLTNTFFCGSVVTKDVKSRRLRSQRPKGVLLYCHFKRKDYYSGHSAHTWSSEKRNHWSLPLIYFTVDIENTMGFTF